MSYAMRYNGWVSIRKGLKKSFLVVDETPAKGTVYTTIVSSMSSFWDQRRVSRVRDREDVPIQPCVPSEFLQ